MNVLGIDFGLTRIGISVASTESGIAFPREVVKRNDHLFDVLEKIIKTDDIQQVVLGLPLKRDGSVGEIYSELDDFAEEIKERFNVPVELYDERYTTKLAEYRLSKAGIKAKDHKDIADSVAAQILLQEWIDELAK